MKRLEPQQMLGLRVMGKKGLDAYFLAGSLTRVQMLPNGRLNLDTVDEFVRSNFHMLVANPFDRLHETEE